MKLFQSSVFRAICAIAIGILLVKYPDNTVEWLTVAIGVLFLLSGIISVVVYVNARRHWSEVTITDAEGRVITNQRPTFPLVGIGSIILGAMLALTPNVFITALMYIIGLALILGAINQFMALAALRRFAQVGFGYWVFPSVILLIGLFVVIRPMESPSMAMCILGWCSLLYGVTELINALKIHNGHRQFNQQEIPVAEEITESDTEEQSATEVLPTIEEQTSSEENPKP